MAASTNTTPPHPRPSPSHPRPCELRVRGSLPLRLSFSRLGFASSFTPVSGHRAGALHDSDSTQVTIDELNGHLEGLDWRRIAIFEFMSRRCVCPVFFFSFYAFRFIVYSLWFIVVPCLPSLHTHLFPLMRSSRPRIRLRLDYAPAVFGFHFLLPPPLLKLRSAYLSIPPSWSSSTSILRNLRVAASPLSLPASSYSSIVLFHPLFPPLPHTPVPISY
ncbi:hypothetical protein R3P38DRAFT_3256632, partial [Favolaschia claudopus]